MHWMLLELRAKFWFVFPKRVGAINFLLHFSSLQEENQTKSDLIAGNAGTATKMHVTTSAAHGPLFGYLNSKPNPIGLAVLDCRHLPPPSPTHPHTHCQGPAQLGATRSWCDARGTLRAAGTPLFVRKLKAFIENTYSPFFVHVLWEP